VRVLVSHPHAAAFASAVARALDEGGALAAYVTGVAAAPGSRRAGLLAAAARARPELRNRAVEVDPRRLRARWSVELLARAAARTGLVPGPRRAYDAMFVLHDAVVAASPWPAGTDAVYAYEDGAQRTFRAARRRGVACVWDLPLPHWRLLERMWVEETVRWPGAAGAPPLEPGWKRRRKEQELSQADAVFVASEFTRASLEAVGCAKPIVVAPYGFPVEAFRPKARQAEGPFTVLAAGTQDLRKGTPYLLEAWNRAGLRDARLRLVGPMRLTEAFVASYRGSFEHVPHLARAALEAEYQAADLLAFPTLGDGFGLVMQEAMCCGTPVVTTRCGGGPHCIDDGVDGMLVPERNVDALVEVFRAAAADREKLGRMGAAARRRAEMESWGNVGKALPDRLAGALGGRA
jgi:glycosyltransferase involved in cell wall biosynthesis